jgi:hypothetical protein
MEHHHISSKSWPSFIRCIDIYLDHDKGEVCIEDTINKSNRIVISAADWNELVGRIKAGTIGKVGE